MLAGATDHVVAGFGAVDAAEVDDVFGVGIFQHQDEEVVPDQRHVQDLRTGTEVQPGDR